MEAIMYQTLCGDQVTVSKGDRVYVDEGDSVGCYEYFGEARQLTPDTLTIRLDGGSLVAIHPADVIDLHVIPEGEL